MFLELQEWEELFKKTEINFRDEKMEESKIRDLAAQLVVINTAIKVITEINILSVILPALEEVRKLILKELNK